LPNNQNLVGQPLDPDFAPIDIALENLNTAILQTKIASFHQSISAMDEQKLVSAKLAEIFYKINFSSLFTTEPIDNKVQEIHKELEEKWQAVLKTEGHYNLFNLNLKEIGHIPREANNKELAMKQVFYTICKDILNHNRLATYVSNAKRITANVKELQTKITTLFTQAQQKNYGGSEKKASQEKIKQALNDLTELQNTVLEKCQAQSKKLTLATKEYETAKNTLENSYRTCSDKYSNHIKAINDAETPDAKLVEEKVHLKQEAKIALRQANTEVTSCLEKLREFQKTLEQRRQEEMVKLGEAQKILNDNFNQENVASFQRLANDINKSASEISESETALKTLAGYEKRLTEREIDDQTFLQQIQTEKFGEQILEIHTIMNDGDKKITTLIEKLIEHQQKLQTLSAQADKEQNNEIPLFPFADLNNNIKALNEQHATILSNSLEKELNNDENVCYRGILSCYQQAITCLEQLNQLCTEKRTNIIKDYRKALTAFQDNLKTQVQFLQNQRFSTWKQPENAIQQTLGSLSKIRSVTETLQINFNTLNNWYVQAIHKDINEVVNSKYASLSDFREDPNNDDSVSLLEELQAMQVNFDKMRDETVKLGSRLQDNLRSTDFDLITLRTKKIDVSDYEERQKAISNTIQSLTANLDTLSLNDLTQRKIKLLKLETNADKELDSVNKLNADIESYTKKMLEEYEEKRRAEEKAWQIQNHATWKKMRKLTPSERAAASVSDKIVFIHYECNQYADHLRKEKKEVGVDEKLPVIERCKELLNEPTKSETERLESFSRYFIRPQTQDILKQHQPHRFRAFFQSIVSAIFGCLCLKNWIYPVQGAKLINRIQSSLSFFPGPTTDNAAEIEMQTAAPNQHASVKDAPNRPKVT
jgi:hypothetical protein